MRSVQEGPGAAGTRSVHPHVRGLQAAGALVPAEEEHLGVLPAQLDGGAHVAVPPADGDGVGHYLLDEGETQLVRRGLGPGPGEGHPELPAGEVLLQLSEAGGQALGLLSAVALVAGMYDLGVVLAGDHDLGGGGADVDPHMVIVLFHRHDLDVIV